MSGLICSDLSFQLPNFHLPYPNPPSIRLVLQENMTSVAAGDDERFAIISQAIQKDEKICRLNDQLLEHDKVM